MPDPLESEFERVVTFRASLTPETDRGCALMAAAYLDQRLYDLLKAYFVDDPKTAEDLLDPSKPVGSFSARIDLAYALGLMSREDHRALHLVRKIRNEFGHVAEPISFENQNIAERCKRLESLGPWKRDGARWMFTGTDGYGAVGQH